MAKGLSFNTQQEAVPPETYQQFPTWRGMTAAATYRTIWTRRRCADRISACWLGRAQFDTRKSIRLTMEYVHYVGLMAITLSLLLAFGPEIRGRLHNHQRQVSSFGGGVAIAYVFLILFPEVEHSREILGAAVHVIIVLSLLIFFALELTLSRLRAHEHSPDHGHHNTERFWFHIAIIWIYTWLVMFTVPEDAADNVVYVLAASATIGVHLLYKDYVLRGHYEGRFEQAGRFILALAPIAGWLSHQIIEPTDGTLEIMIAILAGILIQSVFQDELPPVERMSYRWLVGGVVIMAGLSLFA
jgi:hypothetical protein